MQYIKVHNIRQICVSLGAELCAYGCLDDTEMRSGGTIKFFYVSNPDGTPVLKHELLACELAFCSEFIHTLYRRKAMTSMAVIGAAELKPDDTDAGTIRMLGQPENCSARAKTLIGWVNRTYLSLGIPEADEVFKEVLGPLMGITLHLLVSGLYFLSITSQERPKAATATGIARAGKGLTRRSRQTRLLQVPFHRQARDWTGP